MARKSKIGIDYFSHDVDLFEDIKIKYLKAKHGLIGYAIFLRLLELIYKENGYFLEVNEDFNILFCDENNLDIDVYINVLNDCIKKDLFDNDLYEKYNILTSKRIQENYISATERRKEVFFLKEYLLLENVKELYSEKINVYINSLNADINPLNVDDGTQSKVKESKVNKNKLVEEEEEEKNDFQIFGEYENVFLADQDHKKLEAEIMSKEKLSEFIEVLSVRIETGKENEHIAKGKGHLARIRDIYKYRKKFPEKFSNLEKTKHLVIPTQTSKYKDNRTLD